MKRLEMVWNLLERLGAAVAALGFAICLSFGFVSCLTPDGMLVGPHPADGTSLPYDSLLAVASAYADSVYFANVDGDHEQAVVFADSAVAHLNRYAAQHAPTLRPLAVSGKGDVVEKNWWMADFETDYFTILDIRNELAIANLALCRWSDYRFNNRAYTELYKLLSEDTSLADYCRRMQRSYREMVALVVLCGVLLLTFLAAYLLLSVRPRRRARQQKEERNAEYERTKNDEGDLSRLQHEENRLYVQNLVLDNCLSAIKHETMYYPARIKQLADGGRMDEMQELVDYYSDIYGTLTACAARQLETVTFRRSVVPAMQLGADAPDTLAVDGDRILLEYMVECLRQEAAGDTTFTACADGDFVRFTFVDHGATATDDELPHWFDPAADNMRVLLRQIVREHDEYFNHIGCRIRARRADDAPGVAIVFTLPRADKQTN